METMLKKIVEYDYERVRELILRQTHVKKRKRKKEKEGCIYVNIESVQD